MRSRSRMTATLAVILFIVYSIPISFATEKPALAVFDFQSGQVPRTQLDVLTDELTKGLIATDSFRVMRRSDRDAVLLEQEYVLSGPSDESSQLQLGRLLLARYIVVGNVTVTGGEYYLVVKLLDVVSGEAIRVDSEVFVSIQEMLGSGDQMARRVASDRREYQMTVDQHRKELERERQKQEAESRRLAKRNSASSTAGRIGNFIGGIFRRDLAIWNVDFGIGYGNGVFTVRTDDLELQDRNCEVLLLSAGLGYYLSNSISATLVVGVALERYYEVFQVNSYDMLFGGRIYFGNLDAGPGVVLEAGYMNSVTGPKSLFYSFGLYLIGFTLTVSPLSQGIYFSLGYTIRIPIRSTE